MADDAASAKAPILRARTRARRSAVQALYQWLFTGYPMEAIIAEFEEDRGTLKRADNDYFRAVLRGCEDNSGEIEQALAPLLDRPLAELDPVERAVLHLALYELRHRPELPAAVVLNEAIDLAKLFGAEGSYKYVNGVLDLAIKTRNPPPNGAA